jgi:hypothetical protein
VGKRVQKRREAAVRLNDRAGRGAGGDREAANELGDWRKALSPPEGDDGRYRMWALAGVGTSEQFSHIDGV